MENLQQELFPLTSDQTESFWVYCCSRWVSANWGEGLHVSGWGYMHGGGATLCLHHCPSRGQGCRRTPADHCHTGARCVTLRRTDRQEERDRHVLSKHDVCSVNTTFSPLTSCLLDPNKTRGSSDTAGRKTRGQNVWIPLSLEKTHRSPHTSPPSPGWRFHLKQTNGEFILTFQLQTFWSPAYFYPSSMFY